ncbi:MAG: hypothetical protein HOG49_09335 [Candidatus Scalindua sp.]|jgi:hypothetical protein|nr:hypothetical protein [Candidatus Scalindua sp.]
MKHNLKSQKRLYFAEQLASFSEWFNIEGFEDAIVLFQTKEQLVKYPSSLSKSVILLLESDDFDRNHLPDKVRDDNVFLTPSHELFFSPQSYPHKGETSLNYEMSKIAIPLLEIYNNKFSGFIEL